MIIGTSWGHAEVIAAQGHDGLWYAVLRDPAPDGLMHPGTVGPTLEIALDRLVEACGPAARSA
jgi:hypothetical protein